MITHSPKVSSCLIAALAVGCASQFAPRAAFAGVLTGEQFRSSVFSGRSAPGQPRAFLTAMLNHEVRTAQQAYKLLDEQVAALHKAGERDIDQWLEHVEKAVVKFADRPLTAEEQAAARQEIARLRETLQTELFGNTSFYRMALNDVVRADQRRIFIQGAVAEQQPRPAAVAPAAAVNAVRTNLGIRVIVGPNRERLYDVPAEYVKQRVLGSATATEASVRQQLSIQLTEEIKRIDGLCHNIPLSDSQQQKLTLAGRGDVKEWFDRLAELQAAFTAGPLEQVEFARLSQQMSALASARATGLYREGSLFCKTLRRTLTASQLERFEADERQRLFQAIEGVLGSRLPGNVSLNLTDAVRRKAALLIANRSPRISTSPYLPYIVMLQVGELEQEIKPLVDAEQWGKIQQAVAQARQLEPNLRSMGLWPINTREDEDAGER